MGRREGCGNRARGTGGSMWTSLRDESGWLIPAVPVPFDREGRLHEPALRRYVEWMAAQPIAGVAVWAHTGRGLLLSDADAAAVLAAWRRVLPAGATLVAAAGARPD